MFERNKRRSFIRWAAVGLLASLILSIQPRSLAQDATGKILGTVADAVGAVVPDAKVTVTDVATKIARETTTDKDGNFQVISLPIGTYRVTAEKTGFKRSVSDEQKLLINQALRMDVKLEPGSITETVEVSAGAAVIETVNTTLGQSITSRPLVDLPLNGRNPLDLALLQPGVMEHNPDDTSAGTFNIAGGRSDSVTFLIDGGNDNNLLSNGVVYTPNPDAIAEFRILSSTYSAEYGRNAGGVISIVTKSGTNSLHGSAYDYLRNDALNANRFFNNINGLPRDVLKRNQFGFTLGGPILIPKLVNGRERFFWFASYQGQRQVAGTPSTSTTFTPGELNGDFSHSANGGADPGVVAFLQANPFFQSNAALAARGIIDPTRINSTAKKYISNNLIPTDPSGKLASSGSSQNNSDDLLLRFDLNLTQRDAIAVTLSSVRNPVLRPFSQANVPGYPVTDNDHTYFSNFSYTRSFSPTLLNEFRFTAQRANRVQSVPATKLPTPSELGIGVTPDNPTGPSGLVFASGLSTGFSVQGPTALINNTFNFSDALTWTKGSHTWKFGGAFSAYQNNTLFDFFVDGVFFFDGSPNLGGIGSGNDRADFLFGLPDFYLQFGAAPSNIRSKSVYGFAQDEWHVLKNLTLNLGIRYEYSTPKLDTQGRSFSLKAGTQSQRFVNAPNGLLFPGDPAAPKGANFPDKNDWAPRFGFNWNPTGKGKMSLHGGFGVFYDILKGEDNLQYNGQAPFFGFAALFFTPPAPITKEVNIFSDPFGNAGVANSFPSKPPAKNIDFGASGFLPFGGGGVFFVDPHLRTPYTYQYNLSFECELGKNMVAQASYVGSSSHKLTALVDANPFILGTTNRFFNTLPGNDNGGFSYLLQFANVGNANYNSLELSLNKRLGEIRFIGNTYFTLAYTLAHSIDTVSGFRNRNSQVPSYDSKLFRADSDYDVRQRLVFSGGWDLPFDHAWSSGPSRLTKGWSLYPIVSWRTGFPLDVFAGFSASTSQAGPSGAGDRQIIHANLVGGSVTVFNPKLPQTFNGTPGNFYFNPANFSNTDFPTSAQAVANPALRTYGTLPRNAFRGPGRANFDLALAKTTAIFGERVKLEFRAEAFNVFNTVQFRNPDTTITDGTFGQILDTFDPRIIQFALKLKF